MAAITITTHGHACVRLETDQGAVVLDPGGLSDLGALEGATAILVTHVHEDHVDAPKVSEALKAHPDLQLYGPPTVTAELASVGAPEAQVHTVAAGREWEAAGVSVAVVDSPHAQMFPGHAQAENIAYVVDGRILHPGDSFPPPPAGIDVEVLLAPVSGPWCKLAEVAEFINSIGAPNTVPIHDGILTGPGKAIFDGILRTVIPETEYRRLGPGEKLSA